MSMNKNKEGRHKRIQHTAVAAVLPKSGGKRCCSTFSHMTCLSTSVSVRVSVCNCVHAVLVCMQAVDATANVDRGNVHLKKAIRLNTSARWYVFYILIIASLCLLFLDWYSS